MTPPFDSRAERYSPKVELDFNATAFGLAVIGGTGAYQHVTTGTLAAVPGALNAEHLTFQLR